MLKLEGCFEMIVISGLRRPGLMYDSTKLAVLGRAIAQSISERTDGAYIVVSRLDGSVLKLVVKKRDASGNYIKSGRDEQTILAGKISSFLLEQQITANIKVV